MESNVFCFDLDFTLVAYHPRNFTSLLYDALAKSMVRRGHSRLLLDPLWKQRGLEFTQNGLVADVKNCVVMSLNANFKIGAAFHGLTSLDSEHLVQLYGEEPKFPIDVGKHRVKGEYWAFITHYEIMAPALYTLCVEFLERNLSPGKLAESIETDLEAGIIECFDTVNGEAVVQDIYKELYGHPGSYLPAVPSLHRLLQAVKAKGTKLVIVTNSYEKFTDFVCSYMLGPNWRQLFDDVIVGARKPAFFSSEEVGTVTESGIISRGGVRYLLEKYENQSFTFIGDHYIGDTYAPKHFQGWHTVSIVSELQSEEDANGYVPYISRFGKLTQSQSLWLDLIEKHGDLKCASVLDFLERVLG